MQNPAVSGNLASVVSFTLSQRRTDLTRSEADDAKLCGMTRSLARRALGLNIPSSPTPPAAEGKLLKTA